MDSRSSPPDINIKPEHCPEAVIEWYRVTSLKDRKESASRKDLALKAKQHLLSLGWKFWYIDKKVRWELRYTSPTNGKHYISLKTACESCIEEGGCSGKQPSTALATVISLSPSQPKKRPRQFEETNDSTSEEDSEYKATSSTVSNWKESKEKEKNVIQSEPEVTTNSVGFGKRGKVFKKGAKEKNLEGCDKRGKAFKMNNSKGSGKRGKVLKMSVRERYTLVSWLISHRVLASGTNVLCRGSNNVVKQGRLSNDGIICDCCDVIFTVTGFEAHAGCTRHRPSTSICLEDGRSLSQCQREALNLRNPKGDHFLSDEKSDETNDNVCAICGFGGDIVLCDRCPSSFHLICLGFDRVPDGDWFCPSCSCKICYRPRCKEECANHADNNVLVCVQCEQKYHFGCVNATGFSSCHSDSNAKKKNWFCSVVCGNMFLCLQRLIGKPISVGDNLTWTLLKNVSSVDDVGNFTFDEFGPKESKLNAALGVLYDTFTPTIDAITGRELIKDIVFSRDSEHVRLNFSGFYNVVLEKMGEMISVATIRIYGKKVAEVVFVATKEQYRNKGMCRSLMNELEEQLSLLGVKSILLHSSHEAIETWTKSFGFARITAKERRQYIDNTFLEFQNTIMCFKPLNRPIWSCIAGR
ncbi:increased DNA methylation 1 [Cicer arietinum]|uniref:Increased DNA methylation 1 n=1 Tax=Cicer arietinum TaxID=3827 RepID=A0A1S2YBD1_CICAR|nr:increased DNA methylation 1 [Cicer arietinum]